MSRPVVADPSSPSELQTSKPCEVGVPSIVQARLRQTRAYRCVPPSYRARSPSDEVKVEAFLKQKFEHTTGRVSDCGSTRFHIGGVQSGMQITQRLAPPDQFMLVTPTLKIQNLQH